MTQFKPMLAASEIPLAKDLQFPLYASFKLDGIRCPIIDGVAMSRKLLPLPNRFFQSWVQENHFHLNGIDGEVVVGSPSGDGVFNRTTSGIMSRDGEPDFKLYVFDLHDKGEMTAKARMLHLCHWYYGLPEKLKQRVELLHQAWVTSGEALQSLMDSALERGYEGLILKHPDHSYKFGRSTIREGTLLKWKEFMDSEAVVLEVVEGETNTNTLEKDALGHAKRSTAKSGKVKNGSCGGFRVRSDEFGEFYVGRGSMVADQAKQIWENRDSYVGQIVTFKYQPYGVLKSPRFPGWKGFRDNMDF